MADCSKDCAEIALCNAHYLAYPLERFLQAQRQARRSHIALYGSEPHIVMDHYGYQEASAVRAQIDAYGMTVDSFQPRAYGYSLFAEHGTEHFTASKSYYCNCVRASHLLGAKVCCLYPQNGLLSQDRGILMLNAINMLESILVVAREENVRIALGTNRRPQAAALNSCSELCALLAAQQDPYLGALLDTHVVSEMGETIDEWLDALGDRLFYVHLCDGRSGGYRAWGKGVYPMHAYYQKLRSGFAGDIAYFLPSDDSKPPHPQPEEIDAVNLRGIFAAEEAFV